jgi:hypothetical protein
MKQIKILIGTFCFSLLILASCQKTTVVPNDDDLDVVSDFASITSSIRGDSTDPSHHKCHFNITEIDIATLTSTITTYITTNYPGSTINRAGTDTLSNFYIKITKADGTHVGLLFDKNGVFVKEIMKGRKDDKGNEISVSNLPANVTAYITTNYAAAKIKRAKKLTDGSFVVIIEQADDTYLGLVFDASGVFISTIAVSDKQGRRKGRRR